MRRSVAWLTAAIAVLVLTADARAAAGDPFSSGAADQLTAAAAAPPAGFTDTTVWSGLTTPTTLRWAPDGRVFVALKSGIINVYDSVDDPTPTVYADLRTNVDDFLDRGLLGLAVDPRFTQGRPYLYALYTYDKDPSSPQVPRWGDDCPDPPGADGDGCVVLGRLSRIDPDGSEHPLITDWCNQFSSHTIGALEFGPDGALYASGGDGASFTFADYGQSGSPRNPCGDPPGGVGGTMTPPSAAGGALRSQSFRRPAGQPVSLSGSIIRVDPDTGAALPGNPAASDPDPNRRRMIAYGVRNPFRFAFRPGTEELWFGDVGWYQEEEVNRLPDRTAAGNFGWPCYEGAARMASYDNLNLSLCETLYAAGTARGPHWQYNHGAGLPGGTGCATGTSSVSGLAFYTGTQFPAQYRNALFIADYARRCIIVMPAGPDGVPDPAAVRVFESDAAGPVDIQQGPDGRLYYADLEGGTIRRIAYPAGNSQPVARATATPDQGRAPLDVAFDGSASSDPDGGALTYSWDLNGDGTFGDATIARPAFTYTAEGSYTVRLRVTDAGGASDTVTVPITVGDPPEVTIDSPTAAFTWAVGDAIAFAGSATDGRGDPIPPSGLRWQLNLLHCARTDPTSCHTHPGAPVSGASGTMIAPNHDYPSRLELVLTATDAHGLTASRTVTLDPKTVDITLASDPAGADLTIGGDSGRGPFTQRFIQNATTDITAPTPQTIGGLPYAFTGWSDGGAITHTITVPRTDTTYMATFVRVTEATLGGADVVGTNTSGAATGRAEVYRTTAAVTGSVTKLRLYVDGTSTATRLALGLYADAGGEPGALLRQGSAATVTPGAWNEVTLSTAAPVTQGTAYWIGLLNPSTGSGTLRWRDHAGGSGGAERTSASSTLAELPANWTTGGRYSDGPVSAAMIGAPGEPSPAPVLSVTPTSLAFSGVAGGPAPAAKNLTVSNAGSGSLDFTASDDAAWMSVSPISGPAARDVTVALDTAGLAAGTYTGTVTIAAAGADGSPKLIPVTLTLTAPAPPALMVTPSSLRFDAVAGAGNPAAKTIAVANGGGGTLSYAASDDASWLSLAPASGAAPAEVTATVETAGLAAGTHTASVTITAAGASGSPQVVPVTLTVAPPGGELLGGANVIGTSTSAAPVGAAEAYRLTAATTGTTTKLRLYVDGASAATRLTLGLYGDASGTPTSLLGSGTITSVTAGAWNEVTLTSPVSVTAGGAYWFGLLNPAGSGGTLRWRDHAGGSGGAEKTSADRNLSALPGTWATLASHSDGPVSGTLWGVTAAPPSPVLGVSPASLSFSVEAGAANPAAKTLSVTNTGGGTLSFSASDDAPWLSVTPTSGTAPRDLSVAVDASGLAAGTYTGAVTVTAAGTEGSPKTVPVTLTVTAPTPPSLAVAPASLAFSAAQGGAAPPAQPISVTNTGSGSLPFTVSDDAAWLSAAPASGTANATVNISVDPAGLAPGTYSGTVTVSGGSAGTKTVAVSLTMSAPATGLVGAWGFDEASGTSTTDGSGRGNTGTIAGATRTAAGRFGGALTFDGINDWVTVADAASLRLTTGATVEGWVRPSANGSASWRTVAIKESSGGLAYALYAYGDGGLPSGHAFTSAERWARASSAPPVNTWTHLATTYDGTTIRLYVGGTQVATQAQTGALVAATGPLRFGGNAVWPEWFQGQLDELRVYNRALTAAEIQGDMTRPVSAPSALAAGARSARVGRQPAARRRAGKRKRNPGVQRLRYRAKRAHGGGRLRPKTLKLRRPARR